MGRGKDDPHLRGDLREKGEQLPVIASDFAFVKTTSASRETEQKYATTLVAVDADLFFVKAIFLLGKETTDYSATGLIEFIEGFFHKHVRLRCDGEPATVALANKVKNLAGDLVNFDTTPKHSSASNPAERAMHAVEEQVRTIRADCQMRLGSGETFGADKPIWAWLLSHAGGQISRYKQKGNGMTAYKQAHGEHYTHDVVPFAEIVLVRVPKPTHRGLQGGRRWHTRATRCSSRVFGLVEARRLTNTSLSRLEVSCFRKRFDDWNRLVDTMLDFSVRWRVYRVTHRAVLYGVDRERNLLHHHPFWLERTLRATILTCQAKLRRRSLRRPRRQTTRMTLTMCL